MDSHTSSDVSWELVYSSCNEFLNFASITVVDAAVLEQNGNIDKALKKLENLRKEIDQILECCEQPNSDDPFVTSVKESISEVKSLREKVIQLIVEYHRKLYAYVELAAPPTYEEVMSTVSSSSSDRHQDDQESTSHSLSYRELGNILENLKGETRAQSAQLFYSCDNVTLYFISSNGTVSVSDGPDTVRIFEIEDGNQGTPPKYYLQVFIFVYPLVPRVSPCIRTEFGAILLPNINVDRTEETDVQSIGLLVPSEQEASFISCLENILQTKIVFCDTKNAESVSAKISDTINAGAECVAKFLVQSAEKAQGYMDDKTPKIIDKIHPSRRRRVVPCMSNGIKIARDVTGLTAGITGFVASTVGNATYSLGQFLAPHIKEKGSKLISSTTGVNEKVAGEKIDAVFNVTAGAVEGVGTVYQGLAQSARIFGRSLSSNTIQIVKHKYGDPAAEFTQDTFETVSNGVEIGTHLRFFKPTTIAKNTAKGIVIKPQQGTSGVRLQQNVSEKETKCNNEIPPSKESSQVLHTDISQQSNRNTQAQSTESEILQPSVISQQSSAFSHHRAVQSTLAETQTGVIQDLLL